VFITGDTVLKSYSVVVAILKVVPKSDWDVSWLIKFVDSTETEVEEGNGGELTDWLVVEIDIVSKPWTDSLVLAKKVLVSSTFKVELNWFRP